MPPPSTYHCDALILKHIPFGESGLLVTFYTADRGKVRAVARGARRSNSKLVGHLEPLTQARLTLRRGRNLDDVEQVQVIESFGTLKEDLDSITNGFYVAELVDGFGSENGANHPLYQLAVETLHAVSGVSDPYLPLRCFDLQLLNVSGLKPELYRCVECSRELEPARHRFSPALGGTLCLDCRPTDALVMPLSLQGVKVLRLLDRSSPAGIQPLRMSENLKREVQGLLEVTLEYWLDFQIRSNSFLKDLHRESHPAVYT